MMVANGGTPMNNATMPDQLAKGVPNVFPLTSARSMYEPLHHLKFGLAASYYDQMRAGVKLFVEQHHSKTICAMSQDTDFGRDVMAGAKDQLAAMNLKLVAETLHKPTDTDFSASVARLQGCQLRPDPARHASRATPSRSSPPCARSAGTSRCWARPRAMTRRWPRCRAA